MIPRVLIADREARIREECRRQMIAVGFDVSIAADGLQCLELLQRTPPDVLILDPGILWGGGNGVLECLRDDFPDLTVTVLIANGSSQDQIAEPLRALVAGSIVRPRSCADLAGYSKRLENELFWSPQFARTSNPLAVERCYR